MYAGIFFETPNGKSPIKKFIDSLSTADQARFTEVHDAISTYGFAAVRIIFKPIDGKLWEIKFRSSGAGYRIFYVMLEKDLMVWLHAFSKKSQKTPKIELEIARKRMKEVLP